MSEAYLLTIPLGDYEQLKVDYEKAIKDLKERCGECAKNMEVIE